MSRFHPKTEKLLPKTVEETQPQPQPQPQKTAKTTELSQLYQTVKVHIEALEAKGKKAPKISPSMSDEELQKILDEIHALKIL